MSFFELDDLFTYQDANDIKKLWAESTAPTDPGDGEVWLDISASPFKLKRYNGTDWDVIAGAPASELLESLKTVDGTGSGLDADKVDGLEASAFVRNDAVTDINSHTEWQDTCHARFGNDGDLTISHNGTSSYIDNNTGQLYIRQLNHGSNIQLQAEDTSGTMKTLLTADPDKNVVEGRIARSALVELWKDNVNKIATSPFIQSGLLNIAVRIASGTPSVQSHTFDYAFSTQPRIAWSQSPGGISLDLSVISTTGFTIENSSVASGKAYWIAVAQKL